MSIDLQTESLLTIPEACKSLPGSVHISTMFRWMQAGCRGVKLESIAVGCKRYTSREALQRFADRTTAVANGEPAPIRTPAQRRRAIEAAERALEKDGI